MDPRAIVIIPTYNESENIEVLIDRILSVEPSLDILVIDDNSPDGTWSIVSRMAEENRHVTLLHRKKKRDRGTAVIAGLRYAIGKGYDYVIEMDADLSHDPRYIPLLLESIKDSDVVIGSRYVEGGCDCRGLVRRLLSRIAGIHIRLLLGIKIKDPTSGYRCFTRDILKRINLDTHSAKAKFIVIDILYRCNKEGARIKEVPIRFINREKGKSKLNIKSLALVLWNVLRLRLG